MFDFEKFKNLPVPKSWVTSENVEKIGASIIVLVAGLAVLFFVILPLIENSPK